MLADLGAILLAVLLLAGIALAVYLWRARGRAALLVDVLTQPPAALSPGLVGLVLHGRIAPQDIVALLLDLAQRGYLRVCEQHQVGAGRECSLQRTEKEWADLEDYEQLALRQALGGARAGALSDLDLTALKRALYRAAVQQGYCYADPERIGGRVMLLGLALAGALLLAGFGVTALTSAWLAAAWCPFVSLSLGALALTIVIVGHPLATRSGASAAVYWRAFARYLEHIERYTDVTADPALFALCRRFGHAAPLGGQICPARPPAGAGLVQPATG